MEDCNNLSSIFPANRLVQLPALESLKVKGCKSLKYIFSSSTATSLQQLTKLKVEGCEMMTEVIQNDEEAVDERIKVDLKEQGTLTITDFHLAGDHLIAHYSSWSWETIYVDDDIVEQYLIARNVPCLKKPRTYDVSITYDQTYRTSRLWLKGYDESKADLPLNLIFEDINMKYLYLCGFLVCIKEDHPYESGPYTSLLQRDRCSMGAKGVFNHLHEKGFDPKVQNHLQLFVDFLFPTIQFGPAP